MSSRPLTDKERAVLVRYKDGQSDNTIAAAVHSTPEQVNETIAELTGYSRTKAAQLLDRDARLAGATADRPAVMPAPLGPSAVVVLGSSAGEETLEQMLARATSHRSKKVKAAAAGIVAAIERLEALLLAEAKADRIREQVEAAKQRVAELQAQLAATGQAALARGHDRAAIRAWAKDNGVNCPALGRLSKDVLDAYAAAHPTPPPPLGEDVTG